ncbi:MAG: acetyl-CoA carboxylase biotin carboxyl carrier protein [Phycisphaeraceae bacterium]|nr:acetyl-CoA carboxylase biotin carboxyl carrier protein [Phycisphaeraceae bacterium]
MIDLKTLRSLIKLMVDNDLSELDLRDGDETVAMKRAGHGAPVVMHQPAPHYAPPPMAPAAPGAASAGGGAAPEDAPGIESPMVGTFYSAADPDSPPFVSVGDSVGPDTVVCIIEAMKVFNEVKAGMSGVVERVLVENAEPVEFGQKLFVIRPS